MLRGKKREDILKTEETSLSLRNEERKMSTTASLQGQEDVKEVCLTFTVGELCLSQQRAHVVWHLHFIGPTPLLLRILSLIG